MTKAAKKIISPARLAGIVRRLKTRGKRVVFTNGVFDLIHAGHIAVLEKARALGDCLVVGVNSDHSVRRLKGPKRPLAHLADRARVLAALESVDYVTSFGEDTPQKLIKRLKPTILVKGGDYSLKQIVGREVVKKVVRVPLVKGRSTTLLVAKILKAYGKMTSLRGAT